MTLTIDETKLLYNFLKHQFISYENIELVDVIRKIRIHLDNEELDELSNDSLSDELFE